MTLKRIIAVVQFKKMHKLLPDQGRIRVCGSRGAGQEGVRAKPAPERFAGQKGPFMDGHYLDTLPMGRQRGEDHFSPALRRLSIRRFNTD